jgi:peptide/nickel transport system ATP-binding protein
MDISNANREQLRALHHEVGIVFQDPSSSLNPRMTIGESIAEPIKLSEKIKGAPLDKRVRALLDSVRLPREYASRYPHELSGGQKQRVASPAPSLSTRRSWSPMSPRAPSTSPCRPRFWSC